MNQCVIEPTLFINQRAASMTVGWRAHDDEQQTYENTWHDGTPSDDLQFLRKVLASNNTTLWSMIENCKTERRGVFIAEKYYPWNEIESLVHEATS